MMKLHLLNSLNDILETAKFTYIVQPEPLGLGHAVLMAESAITAGEFFCVMLPDNIIESSELHMQKLIALAQKYNATIITAEAILREDASQYAVITPGNVIEEGLVEVCDIVEKKLLKMMAVRCA